MRVCFIAKNLELDSKSASYGGHRRFAYELITRIGETPGFEVILLAEKISGFPPEIQTMSGVVLGASFLKNYFRTRKIVKECDIVHAIDGWPSGVIGFLLNMGLGKKLVITAEGTSAIKPLSSPTKGFLLKKSYKSADAVVAISKFTKVQLEKNAGVLNVKVINHGVDSLKFGGDHSCNISIFEKIKNYQPYIISTGDIRERKGYHISLPAFAEARRKFPELNYVIVGFKQKNDYVERIKAIIKEKGLERKVHLLEDVSDDYLEELYAHAELFMLLPVNIGYDFEGFGLVFLEAAINGLPSITTRGNGSEDAVIDGETGILVAQNNAGEAAMAIEKILLNSNLRETTARRAREFARKMSWDNVCKQYIEIYKLLWSKTG